MSMAMMGNELLICSPLPIRHKMAEKGHRFVSVYRERAKWLWGDIHSLFSSHVETVCLLSRKALV